MNEEEKLSRLEALYGRIEADPEYRSRDMGSIFVPGRGSIGDRPLVFVGEAPGRDEERERSPFVGAAGRNLNSLLLGIGLSRDSVFVTNLVKYRPFAPTGDNRSPSPAESRRALPYLIEELGILAPLLVICLGLSSAKALIEDPGLKMSRANGESFMAQGHRILVTYHPSPYNYRIPEKRAALEEAFRKLREVLLHST